MTEKNFVTNIRRWLYNHHIFIDDIKFGDDFGYDIENNTVIIGLNRYPEIENWFQKYVERRTQWENVPIQVLQFFHELGHSQTINNFSNVELVAYDIAKKNFREEANNELTIEYMNKYMGMPDEHAANHWMERYMNFHYEEFGEFIEYFVINWNDFMLGE